MSYEPTSEQLAEDLAARQADAEREDSEADAYARTAATVLALRDRAYDDVDKAPQLAAIAQLELALTTLELEELRRRRWANDARGSASAIEEQIAKHADDNARSAQDGGDEGAGTPTHPPEQAPA